jgi:hypothetical protein
MRKLLPIIVLILLSLACSSGKTIPIIPDNTSPDKNPLIVVEQQDSNHNFLGTFTATFDIETLEASVESNRTLDAHHNVTGMIPDPRITVNSWDPVEEIVDVDIQLHNPTWATAYDVRLIIFTDDDGHTLLNADNWTPLWDIPGGQIANPFKAYAKHEINRAFTGLMWHQENFQIKCPNSNFNVQFAVDASYPGNCEEPYEISNFQQGYLRDEIGESATVTADILDWQDDVSEVLLHCPAITNQSETPLEFDNQNQWKLNLINVTGASIGTYNAYLRAESSNSGSLSLYDQVSIKVSQGGDIPVNPQIVGHINLLERSTYVVSDNNLICTINGYYLILIDASNPNTPKIISTINVPYSTEIFPHFFNDSLLVFMRDWYKVIDISDPENPSIVHEGEFHLTTGTVTIKDNLVFSTTFTLSTSKMDIFDFTDPFNPIELGTASVPGRIYDIEIKGDYAYLLNQPISGDTLLVYDISDLSSPQFVASTGSWSGRPDAEIHGDYLYLGTSNSSWLRVIDISNPLNPVIFPYLEAQSIEDLEIHDNYLYAVTASSTNDSLIVYSLAIPEEPVIVSNQSMIEPLDISVFGEYVYIADGYGGIKILDASEPSNPYLVSELPAIDSVKDIEVKNNEYVYVASSGVPEETSGLNIYDIRDLSNPVLLSFSRAFSACHIEYDDDSYVYVLGEDSDGYKFISTDVNNPLSPQVVSYGFAASDPVDLAFEGDIAIGACNIYMNTWENPCSIYRYDTSDPLNITRTGEINLDPDSLNSVAISGDYAYVSSSNSQPGELMVIDISDPGSFVISSINDDYRWSMLAAQGNYLYNYKYDEFSIFDISDPASLRRIQTIDISLNAKDLAISGDYAYIVSRSSESHLLQAFDITDPSNPYLLSTLDLSRIPARVKIYENYAYIVYAAGYTSDSVIDIVQLW